MGGEEYAAGRRPGAAQPRHGGFRTGSQLQTRGDTSASHARTTRTNAAVRHRSDQHPRDPQREEVRGRQERAGRTLARSARPTDEALPGRAAGSTSHGDGLAAKATLSYPAGNRHDHRAKRSWNGKTVAWGREEPARMRTGSGAGWLRRRPCVPAGRARTDLTSHRRAVRRETKLSTGSQALRFGSASADGGPWAGVPDERTRDTRRRTADGCGCATPCCS
jgi:hypothetical protein